MAIEVSGLHHDRLFEEVEGSPSKKNARRIPQLLSGGRTVGALGVPWRGAQWVDPVMKDAPGADRGAGKSSTGISPIATQLTQWLGGFPRCVRTGQFGCFPPARPFESSYAVSH